MNYFVQGYDRSDPNIFREPGKMEEKDLEIFLNHLGLRRAFGARRLAQDVKQE